MNLRIPGPTPCPEEILAAMAKPMINHRSPEFKAVISRVTERVKTVMLTKNDLLILSTSGTGGLEAAIVNTLSPGERVLCISIGYFGNRFAQIAHAYGAQVTKLDFPEGTAADPVAVRDALRRDPSIKAVLVTHNETSTGVTNDLQAISQVVKGEFHKLLLVDGISSVSSIPLPVDAWGCDVVVTASQKGWMVPPGLAFVSVSPEGWKAYEVAKMPRFYFDLGKAKKELERGQTPWTPTVSVIFAMDVALERLLSEGMERVFQRHMKIGRMTRQGIRALGLSLLPEEKVASNTVSAVKAPDGIDVKKLLVTLRVEHDVVMAGGQGSLEGSIFRMGHLGYVTEMDIRGALDALKAVLTKYGYKGVQAPAR